jgi:hypothetical protein
MMARLFVQRDNRFHDEMLLGTICKDRTFYYKIAKGMGGFLKIKLRMIVHTDYGINAFYQ